MANLPIGGLTSIGTDLLGSPLNKLTQYAQQQQVGLPAQSIGSGADVGFKLSNRGTRAGASGGWGISETPIVPKFDDSYSPFNPLPTVGIQLGGYQPGQWATPLPSQEVADAGKQSQQKKQNEIAAKISDITNPLPDIGLKTGLDAINSVPTEIPQKTETILPDGTKTISDGEEVKIIPEEKVEEPDATITYLPDGTKTLDMGSIESVPNVYGFPTVTDNFVSDDPDSLLKYNEMNNFADRVASQDAVDTSEKVVQSEEDSTTKKGIKETYKVAKDQLFNMAKSIGYSIGGFLKVKEKQTENYRENRETLNKVYDYDGVVLNKNLEEEELGKIYDVLSQGEDLYVRALQNGDTESIKKINDIAAERINDLDLNMKVKPGASFEDLYNTTIEYYNNIQTQRAELEAISQDYQAKSDYYDMAFRGGNEDISMMLKERESKYLADKMEYMSKVNKNNVIAEFNEEKLKELGLNEQQRTKTIRKFNEVILNEIQKSRFTITDLEKNIIYDKSLSKKDKDYLLAKIEKLYGSHNESSNRLIALGQVELGVTLEFHGSKDAIALKDRAAYKRVKSQGYETVNEYLVGKDMPDGWVKNRQAYYKDEAARINLEYVMRSKSNLGGFGQFMRFSMGVAHFMSTALSTLLSNNPTYIRYVGDNSNYQMLKNIEKKSGKDLDLENFDWKKNSHYGMLTTSNLARMKNITVEDKSHRLYKLLNYIQDLVPEVGGFLIELAATRGAAGLTKARKIKPAVSGASKMANLYRISLNTTNSVLRTAAEFHLKGNIGIGQNIMSLIGSHYTDADLIADLFFSPSDIMDGFRPRRKTAIYTDYLGTSTLKKLNSMAGVSGAPSDVQIDQVYRYTNAIKKVFKRMYADSPEMMEESSKKAFVKKQIEGMVNRAQGGVLNQKDMKVIENMMIQIKDKSVNVADMFLSKIPEYVDNTGKPIGAEQRVNIADVFVSKGKRDYTVGGDVRSSITVDGLGKTIGLTTNMVAGGLSKGEYNSVVKKIGKLSESNPALSKTPRFNPDTMFRVDGDGYKLNEQYKKPLGILDRRTTFEKLNDILLSIDESADGFYRQLVNLGYTEQAARLQRGGVYEKVLENFSKSLCV